MTKAQRDFLKSIADDNLPVTFVDASGTFAIYVPRIRFETPHKREEKAEEIAELTLSEASGGPWSGTQAEFLRQCVDDVVPLVYFDPGGRGHPVIVTRLSWTAPHKGPKGIEPVVQLTLVETDHWARYDYPFYDYVRYG